MQTSIEYSIAANVVSRKSDDTIIAEITFVNKCLRIKERDKFLSVLFFNKLNPKFVSDDSIDSVKTSLSIVRDMLFNEYCKRHSN